MKFSKYFTIRHTISRPTLFFCALLLSASMWYMVVYKETMDVEINLNINYKSLPPQLFVVDGLIYNVRERVRGPKMLMEAVPKFYDLPIDLSGVKVGEGSSNIFSIIDEQRKRTPQSLRRAFEVLDVNPAWIKLKVEYIDRINIPFQFNYRSDSDMIVLTRSVSHQSVTLQGPENEIKILKNFTDMPIEVRVDLMDVGKPSVVKKIPVIIPQNCPHVTAEPSSVSIEYEIKGERIEIERFYDVTLAVNNTSLYTVSPRSVLVRLKVPASRQSDIEYLNELRVTALPPDLKPGNSRKVELNFTPPEGMEVIDKKIDVIIRRVVEEDVKTNETVLEKKEEEHEEEKKHRGKRNSRKGSKTGERHG
ncbi:MAG: hypothetical protein IK079_00460 [Desulfovibrio sp.]|nr:hypothetical protein [Desulfovibrio sp.]